MKNNHLFIKISPPASIFLGDGEWNIEEDFEIDGIAVDGNDAPWGAFGDLLVDKVNRNWVGISFLIDDPAYAGPMRQIVEKLDNQSVSYIKELSYSDKENSPRIDINWSDANEQICLIAQLTCGQWFWWYAAEGDWGVCSPIIAFGIRDIEDVIKDFKLNFPAKLKFDTNLCVRSYPPPHRPDFRG